MTRPWREDLSGMKFGRLSVISFAGVKNGHRQWNCVCECGNEKSVSHTNTTKVRGGITSMKEAIALYLAE